MADSPIKKVLPRSLFGRSLMILVTPIILIQAISTFIFFDRHWSAMTDRLAFAVAGEIAVFSEYVERGETEDTLRELAQDMNKRLDLSIQYTDGEKLDPEKKYYGSWGSLVVPTLSRALEKQMARPFNIRVGIDEKWVEVSVQLKQGLLVVSMPQRRLFSSSAKIFLLWMLGSSVVLLVVAVLFMRNQIRPIRRLAIAAEKLGKGREVPFFKPEGAREVRQAARAFLDMRRRIDRQIQQRTAMLAGVSHDLRTPLTRMKLQAEMMDGPDAADLKADIAEMERMINAYLEFARGEGGELPERTDLADMIERVAATARRNGADIDVVTKDDLSLMLRPVAFERCLANLIGNAVKYAKYVSVRAGRLEDQIEIVIDDDGPGVPPELREDVFKPFFRGEASRNKKTGGVGLGLPIAQDIIFAHGGDIMLDNSPMGGLRVIVNLPV